MANIRETKYIIAISCLSTVAILNLLVISDHLRYLSLLNTANLILLVVLKTAHMPSYDLTKYYFYIGIVVIGTVLTISLIALRKDRNEDKLKLLQIIIGLIPVVGLIISNLIILYFLGLNGILKDFFILIITHQFIPSANPLIPHPLPEYILENNLIQILGIITLVLIALMGILRSTGYYEKVRKLKTKEVKQYLDKVALIYDKISFNELSSRLGIQYQEIIPIIEDLIYIGGIKGAIVGNQLESGPLMEKDSIFQQCIICNKPIDEQEGVFCPFCDSYAHKEEFLE